MDKRKGLRKRYPILEWDAASKAVIEPWYITEPKDVPEHCVLCFFQEVISRLHQDGHARVIAELTWEDGVHPVYELVVQERRLAVVHPGVGAPPAAGLLEEIIALGCKKFIVCGGAGVLDGNVATGRIVVPTAALRDEGTSYHYLPPTREVMASPQAVRAIEAVLKAHSVDYIVSKTWTTDAPYRETQAKVNLRKAEGCLTVEMEAAAFFAVAQFRGVSLGEILYAGDDVSGLEWDSRDWMTGQAATREKLFWLATEACLSL